MKKSFIVFLCLGVFPACGAKVTLISKSTNDTVGTSSSFTGSITPDGRYVAFYSLATNLTSGGDINLADDVFVYDCGTTNMTMASVALSGGPANGNSYDPSISSNGTLVVFDSGADNLIQGDYNMSQDVFLRNLQTKVNTLISKDSSGRHGNYASKDAKISADGKFVTYCSSASNLINGDTNDVRDVFLFEVLSGKTILVSKNSNGQIGESDSVEDQEETTGSLSPAISTDGRYIAFESDCYNLAPNDVNGLGGDSGSDIFVHDRITGKTIRVSVAPDGAEAQGGSYVYWSHRPSISADGRYVAFESYATNLVANDKNGAGDIFVHDLLTTNNICASVSTSGTAGNDTSFDACISPDGRYVAFTSYATNLVSGDSNGFEDIFVHDCQSGETIRVSVSILGMQAKSVSEEPAISAGGRYVIFYSLASNFVRNDQNGSYDVFLYNRGY